MPRLTFVDLEGHVLASFEIEHPEYVVAMHLRDEKAKTCSIFGLRYMMTMECENCERRRGSCKEHTIRRKNCEECAKVVETEDCVVCNGKCKGRGEHYLAKKRDEREK